MVVPAGMLVAMQGVLWVLLLAMWGVMWVVLLVADEIPEGSVDGRREGSFDGGLER